MKAADQNPPNDWPAARLARIPRARGRHLNWLNYRVSLRGIEMVEAHGAVVARPIVPAHHQHKLVAASAYGGANKPMPPAQETRQFIEAPAGGTLGPGLMSEWPGLRNVD